MASDDDKQLPEQDPWAGLDIDGEAHAEDAASDVSGEDIPIVVFPPPDVETPASDEPLDAGAPGVISMADAMMQESADVFSGIDGGHDHDEERGDVVAGAVDEELDRAFGRTFGQENDRPVDDAFDDAELARELGLLDVDGEGKPSADLLSGDALGLGDAAESGDAFSEAFAEDVALDAGILDTGMTEESPAFADGASEPASAGTDTEPEGASSVPLAAALATGAAVAAAGGRPAAVKKKGSGLGQLVGVAMGGLMALPITYAILIWGFHKDPFKFGKQVPPQLAFLLPQKLQPGHKAPKKSATRPNLDAATSLDDLPSADEATIAASAETAAVAEDGMPAEPASSPSEESTAVEAAAKPEESPLADATTPSSDSEPVAEPGTEAVRENPVAALAGTASADMPAASVLSAPAPADALSGLDAILADAAPTAPAASAPPAEAKAPLDLTGVEGAAERATQADEALNAMADPSDPERDRRLVVWYKRLARLGEELVRLETTASDSGEPLAATPAVAAELLDRICLSETAVADLDRLDGMWLTSQSRKADGVSLIAVLGTARRVGPYWSTAATVAGGNADGSDRSVAIISRVAPPADTGDRVLVSGVMFDGDAVWAADMRPVAPEPLTTDAGSDAEQEEQSAVGSPAE